MRFWYSTNRTDLETLSETIGQIITDISNEGLIEQERQPLKRYGTIREYDGGFILDYKQKYDEYSDLSIVDINLQKLIN